jgi:zinc protease
VAVLYRVGSRNEGLGETGAAHLLEHMLFKGTPKNDPREGRSFAAMMLEIGASFNATTSYDRTLYYQTIPSGYVDFALELEADRMRESFIADVDRRFEMTVVRNEFERAKSRAGSVLAVETVATAFREHPYHHPPIGWQSDVEAVSTDRLRAIYHAFYRPDNATVFVAGAIDPALVAATIERVFGPIPAPTTSLEDVYTSEPAQMGERSTTVKWRGETHLLRYSYRTPAAFGQRYVLPWRELAARIDAPDALREGAAFAMLDAVLASGPSSRLSRALIETKLCVGVSADTWSSRDPGLLTIGATIAHGVEEARVAEAIETVIDDLKSHGPTEEELDRAKRRAAAGLAFRLENCGSLVQALASAESCGSWRAAELGARAIERVTASDVRAVALEHLREDSRTIGRLIPGEVATFSLPLAPLATVTPASEVPSRELPPPSPTTVTPFAARIARGTLGERVRWIAVDEPGSGIVEFRARIAAGSNFAERPMLANVTAALLSAGTKRRSRIAIEEMLAEAGVSRAYGCDDRASLFDGDAFRISGSCVREGFTTLLDVLAEELSEPAFAEAEFERVRLAFTTRARQARTSTAARANVEFARLAYAPEDPNFESSIDDLLVDLETMSLDDVRAFYARVVRGGDVIVAATGGLGASFERTVQLAFASVPFASVAPPTRVRRPAALPPEERRGAIAIADRPNVDIRIGRATTLARIDAGWTAASVANAILGGSSLSGRLGKRLRVDEGLTYGVGSSFCGFSRDASPWRISLGTNPENVARALDATRDVLARFAADGPTAREIEAAKNGIAGATTLLTSTSEGIARVLLRIEAYELGDAYVDTQRERLNEVSREEIDAAIAAYFGPDDLVVVTAGPEAT